MTKQIDSFTFCAVNEDFPHGFWVNAAARQIVSRGLVNDVICQPVISLASDHLPIILSIDRPPDFITSERRTFLNHGKADWNGFTEFTNRSIMELPIPSNVRVADKAFRGIINTAAARFIPAGRIHEVRSNFPADAAELADERDDIRQAAPNDPRIGQQSTGR